MIMSSSYHWALVPCFSLTKKGSGLCTTTQAFRYMATMTHRRQGTRRQAAGGLVLWNSIMLRRMKVHIATASMRAKVVILAKKNMGNQAMLRATCTKKKTNPNEQAKPVLLMQIMREMPIMQQRIVHTTGKAHFGGVILGFFRLSYQEFVLNIFWNQPIFSSLIRAFEFSFIFNILLTKRLNKYHGRFLLPAQYKSTSPPFLPPIHVASEPLHFFLFGWPHFFYFFPLSGDKVWSIILKTFEQFLLNQYFFLLMSFIATSYLAIIDFSKYFNVARSSLSTQLMQASPTRMLLFLKDRPPLQHFLNLQGPSQFLVQQFLIMGDPAFLLLFLQKLQLLFTNSLLVSLTIISDLAIFFMIVFRPSPLPYLWASFQNRVSIRVKKSGQECGNLLVRKHKSTESNSQFTLLPFDPIVLMYARDGACCRGDLAGVTSSNLGTMISSRCYFSQLWSSCFARQSPIPSNQSQVGTNIILRQCYLPPFFPIIPKYRITITNQSMGVE